jgi:hypothetical protein
MLPHEPVTVFIASNKVTSCIAQPLRFASGRKRAKHSFHKKGIMSSIHFNKVAWEHLHQAVRAQSTSFRHWLTRHKSHLCGSLQMQQRCGQRLSTACPRCGFTPENTFHQLHCSDPDRYIR